MDPWTIKYCKNECYQPVFLVICMVCSCISSVVCNGLISWSRLCKRKASSGLRIYPPNSSVAPVSASSLVSCRTRRRAKSCSGRSLRISSTWLPHLHNPRCFSPLLCSPPGNICKSLCAWMLRLQTSTLTRILWDDLFHLFYFTHSSTRFGWRNVVSARSLGDWIRARHLLRGADSLFRKPTLRRFPDEHLPSHALWHGTVYLMSSMMTVWVSWTWEENWELFSSSFCADLFNNSVTVSCCYPCFYAFEGILKSMLIFDNNNNNNNERGCSSGNWFEAWREFVCSTQLPLWCVGGCIGHPWIVVQEECWAHE